MVPNTHTLHEDFILVCVKQSNEIINQKVVAEKDTWCKELADAIKASEMHPDQYTLHDRIFDTQMKLISDETIDKKNFRGMSS